MDSLQDHFLIAMPHLTEETFNLSVIYICDHSPRGSMGLVINRPMESAKVAMILNALGMDELDKPSGLSEIYYGGPVQPGLGFVLHSNEYRDETASIISDDISLSTTLEVLDDIRTGHGPKQFRLALGYAGWGEGQVEREIANGDWLVIPATADFIFEKADHLKWDESAKRFGIEISDLPHFGGLA